MPFDVGGNVNQLWIENWPEYSASVRDEKRKFGTTNLHRLIDRKRAAPQTIQLA